MRYLLGIIFFFISHFSAAQARFTYKTSPELVSIESSVFYFIDSAKTMNFEKISLSRDSLFTRNTKDFLNFGNTEYPVWIRFDIENLSHEDLYLIQELHDVRLLDVFVKDKNGLIRKWSTGSMRPFGSHFLKRNTTVFDLGNSPDRVFLRIHNPSVYIPLKIGTIQDVSNYLHHYDLLYGCIFGILFALIIYNLFVYVVVRDKLFLYYLCYIISSAYIVLRADNHHHEFIFKQISSFSFDINLSATITIFFTLVFANAYLRIKELAPVFFWILAFLMGIGIALLPSEWIPYKPWVNDVYQLLYVILVVVLFVTSIYIHFLGFKPARFFIVAFGFYIFGVVVILLGLMGVLPLNSLRSAYIYQICSVLEALFFALAVAYRFNTYRKEAKDARELALKSSQKHEELLERNNQLLADKFKAERTFKDLQSDKDFYQLLQQLNSESQVRKISIPSVEGIIMFPVQDINRLEAMGSYCTIHLNDHKKITTSKPMAHFESLINDDQFMRVHKSHIININKIERYIRGEGGSLIMTDKSEVPVSRRLKTGLLQRLTAEQSTV